jgi:hypothetical protein
LNIKLIKLKLILYFVSLALVCLVLQEDSVAHVLNPIQSRMGKVSGTVKDKRGAGIAGIVIIFERNIGGRKLTQRVEANADGTYELELVEGVYRATVKVSGYRPFQQKELRIEAGKTTSMNIVLEEVPRKGTDENE